MQSSKSTALHQAAVAGNNALAQLLMKTIGRYNIDEQDQVHAATMLQLLIAALGAAPEHGPSSRCSIQQPRDLQNSVEKWRERRGQEQGQFTNEWTAALAIVRVCVCDSSSV